MRIIAKHLIAVFHSDHAIDQQLLRINMFSNMYRWNLHTGKCKSLFSRYS